MGRLPCPTEAQEGDTLVAYLRIHGYKFQHSPNETGSSDEAKRRAIRMKRQGTSRGFPDYIIIKDGVLIAIELKRVRYSVTAPEQIEWLQALAACGVEAAVCHGAAEGIEFIESINATSPPSSLSNALTSKVLADDSIF